MEESRFDNMWSELAKRDERAEISPEQKANLIMAAQLNELVRDYANAAQLYKQAGELDSANENKSFSVTAGLEQTSAPINPHLEKIVKKIARWLTVRQQWNTSQQQKAFQDVKRVEYDHKSAANNHPAFKRGKYSDIKIEIETLFPLGHSDPDWKALMTEAGNMELLKNMIAKQLGVVKKYIKKRYDDPKEQGREGLLLASYGNHVLLLESGDAIIWDKELLESGK